MGEVLGNAKAASPGGAASSPLTTKERQTSHFILLEFSFKEKQSNNPGKLLSFGLCTPPLEGLSLGDGWLHMHITGSRAMQSSIRLSLPQHSNSAGSPKQRQDLSTWQRRAWPSVSRSPCQMRVWSRGLQEAHSVGPLNCIAEPSLSLAERPGAALSHPPSACLLCHPLLLLATLTDSYLFSQSFAGSQ